MVKAATRGPLADQHLAVAGDEDLVDELHRRDEVLAAAHGAAHAGAGQEVAVFHGQELGQFRAVLVLAGLPRDVVVKGVGVGGVVLPLLDAAAAPGGDRRRGGGRGTDW